MPLVQETWTFDGGNVALSAVQLKESESVAGYVSIFSLEMIEKGSLVPNSLREHLEYLSALNRIADAAHKRRWAGNRLGELEDAIVNGGEQIWTPLCALVAEFKDDPRAHALIYARLHAARSDWQQAMVARMIMEMVRIPQMPWMNWSLVWRPHPRRRGR